MPSFSVNIPQLKRPESTQDKSFVFPHWNCFCCHDTGTVSTHLLRLVCPEYSIHTHPLILCKNCVLDSPLSPSVAQDFLDRSQCQELDQISRQDWRDTAKNWQSLQAQFRETTNAIAAYTGKSGDQSPRIENIEKAIKEFNF